MCRIIDIYSAGNSRKFCTFYSCFPPFLSAFNLCAISIVKYYTMLQKGFPASMLLQVGGGDRKSGPPTSLYLLLPVLTPFCSVFSPFISLFHFYCNVLHNVAKFVLVSPGCHHIGNPPSHPLFSFLLCNPSYLFSQAPNLCPLVTCYHGNPPHLALSFPTAHGVHLCPPPSPLLSPLYSMRV